MATHRRPKQPSRARVSVLTAAAATAVALSAQAGAAQAAPKPTKESVKAQVDKLNQQAEAAAEKYNGAKEQQQKLQRQVNNMQDEVARQQAEVSSMQGTLGQLASSQYRSGGIDPTVQLMLSSDPSRFLDQASSLDQVSAQQAQTLRQLQEKQHKLDQDKAQTQADLAELDSTTRELKARKAEVQTRLAKAQALLNTLTAQERAALQAAETAAAQRASRAAARTALTPSPAGNGSTAAASGTAQAALAAAKTRIGSPYVYGATGPSTFDCSGLTQWSYARAGVSLPRTSEEQANAGTRLTLSQLQPGDLVFFFSDLHHVGIYAGNGMVLHAPKPGASVRYEAMDDGYLPFQFGVRV
ncbi:NlpC/P60 family protein [Streptacidiphilus sp. ASG 303]|uniref:C40 family peptidase n=1 Tax=Streptacidiphilus sp. ASG 303 TaxID=2896847 RepID=UPI001E4A72A5|nr:C40 family peptidase [Streptacidiphilus sp. ASG 303]MCD0484750.1 NlpC/P60 family protein [Streptacidiphilus sp. ASG 303]